MSEKLVKAAVIFAATCVAWKAFKDIRHYKLQKELYSEVEVVEDGLSSEE